MAKVAPPPLRIFALELFGGINIQMEDQYDIQSFNGVQDVLKDGFCTSPSERVPFRGHCAVRGVLGGSTTEEDVSVQGRTPLVSSLRGEATELPRSVL